MRIRAVVQRYGAEVAGGAESFCRSVSTRLAARGHEVQVITSTAIDYLTWQPEYPAGASDESGVEVIRLDPFFERDSKRFTHLDQRVAHIGRAIAPSAQQDWLLLEGPILKGLGEALRQPTDVTSFYTYLYPTTVLGAPLASPFSPVVLHPTAHSEPQLDLQVFDRLFDHADLLAVSTPEEAELMNARTRGRARVEMLGIGIDPIGKNPAVATQVSPKPSGRPYIAVVGRVDPSKGSMEAVRYFAEFKHRHPGALALLLVGYQAATVPEHPDIITTGFVDEPTRDSLMSDALVLLQPSYFESFSLVLAEAWSAGVPALVQERCPATAGQVRRSGGGLLYHDYASFEAALELLVTSPHARRALGESGRRHVTKHYQWHTVLDRYEKLLKSAIRAALGRLPIKPAPPQP